jgi:uncharacterized protein YacL
MKKSIIFLLSSASCGYLFGFIEGTPYMFLGVGITIGMIGFLFEYLVTKYDPIPVVKGVVGLSLGLLFSQLIYHTLISIFVDINVRYTLIVLDVFFGYTGLVLGLKVQSSALFSSIVDVMNNKREGEILVLDTSVIIDGRVADICETGFLNGTFVLPQFILQELQYIADSSDSLKREKGRRGLEVLHRMQSFNNINVKIVNKDFSKIKEVDAKLVALAKDMGGKIITKDFNLNKVAELQGVIVLNITELASALKPAILPGEIMNVFILKEGKEFNQGVAYLEDGTMVVVENGRKHIGKNIEVVMSSVLQTTAGRMAFARIKDNLTQNDLKMVKNG